MLADRLKRAEHIGAMRRAFSSVKRRQKANASHIPDLLDRKRRLREARERTVGVQAYLDEVVEAMTRNGIRVNIARDSKDAVNLVRAELGGAGLVVKSKSNLTKEIGLVELLERSGVRVIETDIGDRIIQIAQEKASHPTGPASHLSRKDIAHILAGHFGRKVRPVAQEIVQAIREEVYGYITQAEIGITGANAIAADEGAILLQHNEGNIIEVAMRPAKHIVLAGIEKIYPNIEESLNMLRLQTFYATGALTTSFINIVSGPSQTADIEKQLIKGVHGPSEVSVILVDNGRSKVAEMSEYRELLYCIGCGQCLLVCPAYRVYGNKFSAAGELGGRGIAYSSLCGDTNGNEALGWCLTCGKCYQNCPVSINVPGIVHRLRSDAGGAGYIISSFFSSHLRWLGSGFLLEFLLLASKISAVTGAEVE